jgi:hypothetical protein
LVEGFCEFVKLIVIIARLLPADDPFFLQFLESNAFESFLLQGSPKKRCDSWFVLLWRVTFFSKLWRLLGREILVFLGSHFSQMKFRAHPTWVVMITGNMSLL